MCGRYALTLPPDAMRRLFDYPEQPNFPPRWNIAPTQPVPIIRRHSDTRPHVAVVRWGLVPQWAREVSGKPLINARGETVAEKPAFRAAFQRRRCLIPADGFYEWKTTTTGLKQPYLIRRRDRGMMAFAGIWERWHAADGSQLESCCIVTTQANAPLSAVHHRMPVILHEAGWDTWMDRSHRRMAEALALIAPAPDDLLDITAISHRINSVANDDETVQAPAGPQTTVTQAETPKTPTAQMTLF